MKLLVLLVGIVAVVLAGPTRHVLKFNKNISPRIISGSPAQVGQFKYQVGFIYPTVSGNYICGGALLSSRWVLTAAHCVVDAFHFDVFMGGIYSDGTPEPTKQTMRTSTSIAHHSYNTVNGRNDIAMINLNTDVRFTDSVQTISLSREHIGGGNRLTVSGWGRTSDWSAASNTLMWVEINSITNDECRNRWQGNIFDGSLCCRGNPEHGSCQGDSGGPLVKYSNGVPSHVGIVSYVGNSCMNGDPTVYVRTEFYIDWINNNMGN